MRGWITGQAAHMKRNSLPGEPLRIRHRRVIGARHMSLEFLQNGENADRRGMAGLARRAGRNADQDAVAVDEYELLGNGDDDGDGPGRRQLRAPDELARLKRVRLRARRAALRARDL